MNRKQEIRKIEKQIEDLYKKLTRLSRPILMRISGANQNIVSEGKIGDYTKNQRIVKVLYVKERK